MQKGLIERRLETKKPGRLQAHVAKHGGAGDASQPDLQVVRRLVVGVNQSQRLRIGGKQETPQHQYAAHDDRCVDPGESDQTRLLIWIHECQHWIGGQGENSHRHEVEEQ